MCTHEQATTGYGLPAQVSAIEEACARNGWELVALLEDGGASGASLDRPALREALELIACGSADALVVAKLDRASRSIVDFASLLEFLEDAGAAFVALDMQLDTSNPQGRLMASMLALFASYERELIAERTRSGLRAVRAAGKPVRSFDP